MICTQVEPRESFLQKNKCMQVVPELRMFDFQTTPTYEKAAYYQKLQMAFFFLKLMNH